MQRGKRDMSEGRSEAASAGMTLLVPATKRPNAWLLPCWIHVDLLYLTTTLSSPRELTVADYLFTHDLEIRNTRTCL